MSCVEQHAHALLYQLPDGKFQMMDRGGLGPMMTGYEYVLVENQFAGYLECLDVPRLEIVDAVIYDPRKKQEIRTHRQLRIGQRFSADMIRDIDLDGERLLLMGQQYVFVSPSLKVRLEASPFNYLRFSEGLSEFAGSGA